jgi:hypothetical protein
MATSDTETISKHKFDHTTPNIATNISKHQKTAAENTNVYNGWTRSILSFGENITNKQSDRAATPTDQATKSRSANGDSLTAKKQ